MPFIPRPWPAAAQSVGVLLTELQTPPPDGLAGDDHAALEHQLLDLAEGQREPEVQPHAVRDHLDRVPVPPVLRRRDLHERSPSTMINPKIIPPSQPMRQCRWDCSGAFGQFFAGVPQHFLYLRPESHQHGPLRAGGHSSVWSGCAVARHSP